ncbi:MAG: hypothetical protein H0T46_24905 [Deltaproteobacteria bacterium]|nr:hypothetical protein [Deltaproteobacteria bacterium]
MIPFFWGATPEHYGGRVEISWLREPSGVLVPPFHVVRSRATELAYNFGDPVLARVISFDGEPLGEYACACCSATFEAIAVEIIDNRIAAGLAFRRGECAAKFGRDPDQLAVVEVLSNGGFRVHDEWFDPPLVPHVEE